MRLLHSEPALAFEYAVEGEGVVLRLRRKSRTGAGSFVPTADWVATVPNCAGALATVFAPAAQADEQDVNGDVRISEDSAHLSGHFVAMLSASDAAALGLPPPTPLALDLKSRGIIPDRDFRVEARWVQPGGTPVRAEVRGAMLHTASGIRRIPEPLFSAWHAARRLATPLEEQDRYAALAALRQALPEDAHAAFQENAYLADTRIHYASSVSLSLGRMGPFDFDPVLFDEPTLERAGEGGAMLDESQDSLLPVAAQRLFAEDRFRRIPGVRAVYVLRDGEYVFIEPALRPVLNEIRKLQDAPIDERKRFVLNPRRMLCERLGEDQVQGIDLERRFIETEQFSERVAGVDIWSAPVLPWVKPTPNSWLPEKFGLQVGDERFVVRPEQAEPLHEAVKKADAAGKTLVQVTGLVEAAGPDESAPTELPVTPQLVEATASLRQMAEAAAEFVHADKQGLFALSAPDLPQFLTVRDNLEEVAFAPAIISPVTADNERPPALPKRLRTILKPHQEKGFHWLTRAFRRGQPGVLLADDMGLGKTLQALTFMAGLQDGMADSETIRPFLIVAPTGLLQNWQDEIARHLDAPKLGDVVLAFGSGLRLLRHGNGQNDVRTGRAGLDAARWSRAGVILTTFETLRDYHFSFACTRFTVVVYDEIQKLKNPASQITRAAKTLNARFVLGMTGTPVENRLQDLWSIMDVVSPGLLGSSKAFEQRYGSNAPERLTELKTSLTEPQGGAEPVMLRRLKSDHLPGLPEKITHTKEIIMPSKQEGAYRTLVNRAVAMRGLSLPKGGMLSLLHEMRGVSLHPIDPANAPANLSEYAVNSARLKWTLEVLDEIERKREKVLIFLENLAMQERLAALIQGRYRLGAMPMRINGAVAGPKRQELVDRFQEQAGQFDVMILSPKAGGVGLNITAANHVIHLSRWWNPAVEDQSTDRCFRIGQTKPVHVYLPLAVHPDPIIGPTSFDLKLNALLERKRQLSRDMLAPPDGGEGDINALFDAVSGQEWETGERAASQDTTAEVGEDQTVSERAAPQRLILKLKQPPAPPVPSPVTKPSMRVFEAQAGGKRPLLEVAALFANTTIAHIRISDPYALVDQNSRTAQVQFVRAIADQARGMETVIIEYDPDVGTDAMLEVQNCVRSQLATAFADRNSPKLVFHCRRKGRHDYKDFHDREVLVQCRGTDAQTHTHRIWTGRGLVALMDKRYALRLTYQGS